jgi:ABC-type phosphate/phosphonate transport system substrate-binding protein
MTERNSNITLKPAPANYGIRIFFMFLVAVLCTIQIYPQQTGDAPNEVYGVAFLRTMFPTADYNDAKAAIKIYVKNLQDQLLTGFSMKPVYFENTDELLKNFPKENLAVITLSSVDFLAYKSKLSLNPVLVNSGTEDPLETYIILIRKEENISSADALADKKFGMINDPLSVMWLNVLLGSSKISKTGRQFKDIIIDKTESQLILSLFFGQLDGCLVSKTAFETMIEINPQIGSRLKILNSSPRLLRVIASFTTKFKRSRYSESLLKNLTSLENYASGRQLFALTKTAKLAPFKDEYLDNVKALLSDYNKLPKRLIK